jgi:hypothetical protein
VVLAQAPEVADDGFAVPSPQADSLADIP